MSLRLKIMSNYNELLWNFKNVLYDSVEQSVMNFRLKMLVDHKPYRQKDNLRLSTSLNQKGSMFMMLRMEQMCNTHCITSKASVGSVSQGSRLYNLFHIVAVPLLLCAVSWGPCEVQSTHGQHKSPSHHPTFSRQDIGSVLEYFPTTGIVLMCPQNQCAAPGYQGSYLLLRQG